jgi:ketosteroid isomerase-like protein
MKKLLLMTAITAAIFAVDASASLTELPTIAGSSPLKVDFSTSTGVQNVANVPLPNNLYVAGSSAARGFLERTAEAYAKPGSVIYKYQNTGASASIFTYVFTAGDTAAANGLVKDQTYVIHYRTRDGSITAPLISSFPTPDKAVGVTFNSLADFAVKAGEYTCGSASAVTATAPLMVICKSTTSPEKLVVAPANATGAAGKPSVLALSDVDAAQFVSPLNGANVANGLPKKALTMGSTAIAAQVFGIGVNLKLRNAMQTAQLASGSLPSTCVAGDDTEACMPGFTTAQITSIFAAGRFNDWTNLSYGTGNLVLANPGKTPKNTAVHICSRTAGSGTLATFQTVFENAPCTVNEAIQAAVSTTIVPLQSSVLGVEAPSATAKVYHSIESSGDVENCLASLDGYDVAKKAASTTGIVGNGNFGAGNTSPLVLNPATSGEDFRWAVGIFNADRNATNALPYRFIKIDGYSPSLINTANGKYKFWSELSYITPTPTTKLSLTAQAFVNGMSKPEIIAKSNLKTASWDKTAASASGYMATAARVISSAKAFNPASPVMPFTHSNGANSVGSVNHCRAPAILNGNVTLPGLN